MVSQNAESAREAARRRNGEFGTQARDEADVSLTDVPAGPVDYSSWTPVEVDTELARLYDAEGRAMQRFSLHWDYVARQVASHRGQKGYGARAKKAEIEETVAALRAQVDAGEFVHPNDATMLREYDNAQQRLAEAEEAAEAMEPLNDEFEARGGWTRAFLVTNVNGHVHSSMDCSTCFKPGFDGSGNWREGTRYHWVTDLSGSTEADVVDAAGSDACTVCYPTAPVESLGKPRSVFTPDEIDKAKARQEREQAKAERARQKIAKGLTADGSEFKVGWVEQDSPGWDLVDGGRVHVRRPREKSEQFKTEVAATQWLVQDLAWNQDRPGTLAERQPAYDAIIEAIATKHGHTTDEVRAQIDKKVAAKRRRDGWAD